MLFFWRLLWYDEIMKIAGITAEYNPFHKGPRYHIEKTREALEADCIIAVMSGNFTQRGEAAVMDKWTRSRIATEEGVDLVVELPFLYACNRAEFFAQGAVDILQSLGVSHISFGSESGDLEALQALAEDMVSQRETLAEDRMHFMKKGFSFAKSLQLASEHIFGTARTKLMAEPNNILALEYLKRMVYWREQGHPMKAVTVKRYGSGYFEKNGASGYAGASAIRRMIEHDAAGTKNYVPESVHAKLAAAHVPAAMEKEMFRLVRYELIRSPHEELSEIYCMGEGLENKLKKEIVSADSMQRFLSVMVSKRYTEATIRRLLLYVLLGVKGSDPLGKPYARVLAAGEKGRKLLRHLKKEKDLSIPIITNINKDGQAVLEAGKMLEYDCLASDFYNLISGRSLYRFSDKVMHPYIKGEHSMKS